jgi:hypothetical protein
MHVCIINRSRKECKKKITAAPKKSPPLPIAAPRDLRAVLNAPRKEKAGAA